MTGRPMQALDLPADTDRYRLRRLIGQGSSGCVYEAWDRQLHRSVAIKRMPLLGTERALREARSAASLRHPAFVAVHEVFETDGHACIVMELVSGHSLSTLMATQPAQAEASRWMAQCAEALAEAHAMGIAHGDIKPSNLMIDQAGDVRILDFGIACAIDAQRTSMHGEPAAGTLRYMAPELLLGQPPAAATDIYALGLVLHELLSGVPAFGAHHGLALAHHKLHLQEPLPAVSASNAIQQLIQAMTHSDPTQRPGSMLAVREILLAKCTGVKGAGPWIGAKPWRAAGAILRLPLHTALLLLLIAMVAAWQLYAHFNSDGGTLWTWRQLQAAQASLHAYDEAGNLQNAVAQLQRILGTHPKHAGAAAALALAYCMLNGSDSNDATLLKRADVSAQMALRADDQLALAHVARAWFLEGAGRLQEAEVSYRRGLLLDPREFYGLWGQARLLTRMNRLAEARAVLGSALRLYPRETVFHNTLGALLYKQANYRDAEQAFRRSIELKPNSPYGYANLSATLLHQDHVAAALAVLQQGLQIQSNGALYSNLGNSLFALGRYLEAAEAFERALSNSEGATTDYLKWANFADALRWIPGREADARNAYARALQLLVPQLQTGAASDPTRSSRAGLYAARLDQRVQAREWMAAALAQSPDSPELLFRAAVTAELLGERAVALQRLRHSLAMGFPAHLVEQEPDLQALRTDFSYHTLFTENRR